MMDLKEVKYEAPLTRYLFHKASSGKIPLSGTFELTPECNFSCRMCYVRKTHQEVIEHSRPMMTLDQWIEIAQQARESGMLYLLLTGGEPFVWPDFWRLYEELIRMGFLISINSNGSLLNEEVIYRLGEIPPIRMNITLYGANNNTYESLCRAPRMFQKVDLAITKLQEKGILVKLNGSLTPCNVNDLEQMVHYAEKKGLIYEANTYMFPPVRRNPEMIGENERFTPEEAAVCHLKRYRLQYGEERYRQFLKNVAIGIAPPPGIDEYCIDPIDGKIRCRAGNASFWITWDGWMTPCGMMAEPKIDMQNRTFHEAWKQLNTVSEALMLSGVCSSCPNQAMCHSCAAMAIAETGSSSGIPRYLCEMMKKMKELAQEELKDKN